MVTASAGLAPPDASVLGMQMTICSPCLQIVIPLCPNSPFLGQDPPTWPHFNSVTSVKTPSPNTVTLGVKDSTCEWGGRSRGHNSVPNRKESQFFSKVTQ